MLAGSLDFPDAGIPPPASGWTPERQVANMLELCSAQMESALQDSDKAVEALIKVFESVAETSRTLNSISAQLPPETGAVIKQALDQQLEALARQIGTAVVSFQFYDKLTQRLGHVRYSLSSLAQFVCDRAQSSEQDQWRRMLNALRRLYRTDEERRIFQMMTEGVSVELEPAQTTPAGEVEMF